MMNLVPKLWVGARDTGSGPLLEARKAAGQRYVMLPGVFPIEA